MCLVLKFQWVILNVYSELLEPAKFVRLILKCVLEMLLRVLYVVPGAENTGTLHRIVLHFFIFLSLADVLVLACLCFYPLCTYYN